MTVLLISTAWMATLALVVAVCRMAAHGDGAQAHEGRVSPATHAARSPRLLDMARGHTHTVAFRLEDRRAHTTRRTNDGRTNDGRANDGAARRSPSETAAAQHVGHRAQQNLHVGP